MGKSGKICFLEKKIVFSTQDLSNDVFNFTVRQKFIRWQKKNFDIFWDIWENCPKINLIFDSIKYYIHTEIKFQSYNIL